MQNKHINKLFHKFHGFSSKKKHNTIYETSFPGTSHNGIRDSHIMLRSFPGRLMLNKNAEKLRYRRVFQEKEHHVKGITTGFLEPCYQGF